MDAPDDSPQIGRAEADRAALSEVGVSLTELAIELGVELDAALDDIPQDGWRVLRRQADDSILLGTPTDSSGQVWRLALVRSGQDADTAEVLPDIARLRPSTAERRTGLELRWPAFVNGEVDSAAFVIDVVNVGDHLWVPHDDAFHAIGVLTPHGVTTFSFGWVSSGRHRAVPLGPGEYARIPVEIDRAAWASFEAGPHDLHVVLSELNLRSAQPLPVDLTTEVIAQHRSRVRHQQPAPDDPRQRLEARLKRLRDHVQTSASIEALLGAVTKATSDDEAVALIQEILGSDYTAAQIAYNSALREFLPSKADRMRREIEEVTLRLNSL